MKAKYLFAIIFALILTIHAFAHEYWLEPEKFQLARNEKTPVHLFVGDGIVKDREERVFQLDKTPFFELFSSKNSTDLKPVISEGAMPIYNFSADKSGNYLLAFERNWSFIKIESKKFEDYLREDGMEYIIPEREKLGERQKDGRERYSRYIKSLLQVGDKRDQTFRKQLGMKLEIIPLENPYKKKVGETFNFQVFFDGKPLADRAVFVDNRAAATQKMITDKNGKVSFKLDKQGFWLVRIVNMQRCANDCGEADWESFWGALTFGL